MARKIKAPKKGASAKEILKKVQSVERRNKAAAEKEAALKKWDAAQKKQK